ncbi:hypothetical protein THOM_1014, partial [Trachipleistophora hominis]
VPVENNGMLNNEKYIAHRTDRTKSTNTELSIFSIGDALWMWFYFSVDEWLLEG